tara:strand:- start:272 stop:493 length:222 start_codon:yes stop_codon:yes gene_type:complete
MDAKTIKSLEDRIIKLETMNSMHDESSLEKEQEEDNEDKITKRIQCLEKRILSDSKNVSQEERDELKQLLYPN